ncbi:MAG: hypothetical protein MK237_10035, partial [Gemmatimonadetes bacterium]|nr:hypothetical protein [Gemmatimonadota bacterium]
GGWGGGLVVGGLVALYVWTVIQPTDLVIRGWLGTIAAAIWIGSKIAREIIYGGMRFRNAQAVEATPPVLESP